MMALTIKDLKEAAYNPRIISQKRLDNLHLSMTTYGDLSGVVFNKKTNNLISGHQRLKPFRDKGIKTKVDTKPVKDNFGTVAEGWITARTSSGEIRIPLRIVDWSDKRAEMAANIAANAQGGDFDRGKLGIMLEKLQMGKNFDINVLGIDPLSMRSLLPQLPATENKDSEGRDKDAAFPEFGEDSFEFEHECPKCKFQFNTSANSKPKGSSPKAPKLTDTKLAGKKKKLKVKEEDKPKKKLKKKAA